MKMLKSNQATLLTKIQLNLPGFHNNVRNTYKIKLEELLDGMYPESGGDTKIEFAAMEKWVGHELLVDHILAYSKFRSENQPVFDAATIPKLQFEDYVLAVKASGGLTPRIDATFKLYTLTGKASSATKKEPEAEEPDDRGKLLVDCFV
jgi:hypothetical protein